jgi:hypothetical protein
VQHVRDHLFSQYEALITAKKEPGELELAHVEILSERLSLLLSATLGAFTFEAAAKGRRVYEAEWRHDWDEMLYRFWVITGESLSSHVL